MAKTKSRTDEELIAALLQHGTIKAAAAAAGVAPRTFYDRMQEREFRILYEQAKTDLLRNAVTGINTRLAEALETVAAIMADKNNNPATRLQAAQTIINNAGKLAARLDAAEDKGRELVNPFNMLDFI